MGGPQPHDTHAALHGHAAAAAADRAIAELTERGKRITAPRRAVIELLAGQSGRLSAQEVATALAGEPSSAHRATVYRALEQLAELGIVTRLRTASEATGYHLAVTADGHEHLHVRCRGCGLVLGLPVEALRVAADRLRHEHRFRLEPEQSDLVGLCEECSAAEG